MASSLGVSITAASPSLGSGGLSAPASAKGDWADAIADMEATAQSAAELLNPLSTSSTNVHAVKVGDSCTRIMLRGKYPTATAALTTNPVVRVYAVYGEPTSGGDGTNRAVFTNDGTVKMQRIDNSSPGVVGITITIDVTNDVRDDTWKYTAPWSLGLLDVQGASYIVVLLETAAVHDGTGGTIEVLGLN